MEKIGIGVGHYGFGTGATLRDRDEWAIAGEIGANVQTRLLAEGHIRPVLIEVDRRRHPWDLVEEVSKISPPTFLGGWGNVDLRVAWAKRENLSAYLEIHFNRFAAGRAAGHEVFIRRGARPSSRRLGQAVLNELGALGNRRRGLKEKNFRILRKLDRTIPAVLVEPAFLQEDATASLEWRDRLTGALVTAIYRHFHINLEGG
jgi:N-acetylmuramoyl-L-alanine amidase